MMSQVFNMLSRFVMAFLPISKHLLILWIQSHSTVILESKRKSVKGYNFPFLFAMQWWDQISSVQMLSHVRLFATPWTAWCHASPSITNSQSMLKLIPIKLLMPSNHLILFHHLLFPPSIFPNIRVFSNESVLHIKWPNYWSFSFRISTSNEYSWLISFRMDWLDLPAVQGTLKSLLQHHSSKASVLLCF